MQSMDSAFDLKEWKLERTLQSITGKRSLGLEVYPDAPSNLLGDSACFPQQQPCQLENSHQTSTFEVILISFK